MQVGFSGQQFSFTDDLSKLKSIPCIEELKLRGMTDDGLRLRYGTLFRHHGFGPAFQLTFGCRNKPLPGSIMVENKDVIALDFY